MESAQQVLLQISLGETSTLELDRAILAPFGLENIAEEVSAYAESLYNVRKGGKEVGIMIEGFEGRRTRTKKLKGADVISSEQSKLTDFDV